MLFFSIPQQASAVPDSKTIPGSYTIRAHNQGYAGPTEGYSTAVSTSPWSPEKGQEKDSPTHQPHSAPATIMSNHQLRKHDQYLYATAICMAYFGCLRGGEVSYPSTSCYHHSKHLTLKDVSIQDNTIILQLKQSKTDQLGKGSKIVIGQSKQAICPVKITRRFLQYRQQANHSDALFRLKDGSLLTRQRLQLVLRESLTMLNLPAKHFGTHSLRIGSATAAAQAGVPVKIIKALGRWSSDCYRRYIRAPHKSLQELASKLCAPPP